MNNPTIDNDLQKAIDDITKITSDDPIFADSVAAAPAPAPATPAPATQPLAPAPAPAANFSQPASTPTPEPTATSNNPLDDIVSVTEETVEETSAPTTEEIVTEQPAEEVKPFVNEAEENLDKDQVKEAALRDLAPIISKLDISSEKKFDIYKTVIDEYHDSSVIAPAYKTASDIKDDKERAEALLYIIESIDKM